MNENAQPPPTTEKSKKEPAIKTAEAPTKVAKDPKAKSQSPPPSAPIPAKPEHNSNIWTEAKPKSKKKKARREN